MKMKILLLSFALLLLCLASGCRSMRHHDYNGWGVPDDSAKDKGQWHWAPW